MVWVVSDVEHKIVGTQFTPSKLRVGNEELESWLSHHLNPKVGFQFRGVSFECEIAAKNLSAERVLELLNWQEYFRLVGVPEPKSTTAVLESLANERLIKKDIAGQWSITSIGVIALAKRLADFSNLSRKAIRIISYEGKNKLETRYERVWESGYASQFEDLVKTVAGMLPRHEKLTAALRAEIPDYPPIAIRELLANALIHQDFTISGAGPMLEIFVDRIEITNPGLPLVETVRFIDSPPRSRNEALASLFRRFGICEERGSGIDKVIAHVEKHHLPPPLFETAGDFTRCILFGPSPKTPLDKEGRIRACYFHACLYYVSRDYMTNSSLRERFGIKSENKAMVSRYIKETIEAGMIRPLSSDASKKNMKYVPFWA
jgi:predicted HTH transcriptional regulator